MKKQSDEALIMLIQSQLISKIQFAFSRQFELPEMHVRVQMATVKVIQKRGATWREHAESIIYHMKEEAAYYEWLNNHCDADWNGHKMLDTVEQEIKIHSEEFAEQIRK